MDNQVNLQLNENVREEKKERKMKMLKTIFIVSTILLIICFLLFGRISSYVKYGGDVYRIKSKLFTNEDIEYVDIISTEKANKVVLNNLNIYIPEGFELDSFNSDEYCETYRKNYNKLTYDAEIKICDNYGSYLRNTGFTGIEVDEDFKKIMNENNLNNSVDIFKYYINNKDYEASFFDKENDLKLNYYVRKYTDYIITFYDNFYFLENDINGIYYVYEEKDNMIGVDSINRAFIELNDKFYILNFKNKEVNYFNKDIVFEIISSIITKK